MKDPICVLGCSKIHHKECIVFIKIKNFREGEHVLINSVVPNGNTMYKDRYLNVLFH